MAAASCRTSALLESSFVGLGTIGISATATQGLVTNTSTRSTLGAAFTSRRGCSGVLAQAVTNKRTQNSIGFFTGTLRDCRSTRN